MRKAHNDDKGWGWKGGIKKSPVGRTDFSPKFLKQGPPEQHQEKESRTGRKRKGETPIFLSLSPKQPG